MTSVDDRRSVNSVGSDSPPGLHGNGDVCMKQPISQERFIVPSSSNKGQYTAVPSDHPADISDV